MQFAEDELEAVLAGVFVACVVGVVSTLAYASAARRRRAKEPYVEGSSHPVYDPSINNFALLSTSQNALVPTTHAMPSIAVDGTSAISFGVDAGTSSS